MIPKGSSGKDAEIPINLFDANTGAAITGHVWVTGEVLIALPGGTMQNANVANIVEKGRGRYALQLTAAESATTGGVYLDLDTTSGYLVHSWSDVIVDIGGITRDALLNYAFRSGRTVRGFLRRVDALFFGKVTGLKGATVTAYQPGGITTEYTVTQDPTNGNRSEANVTTSETP